MLAAEHRANDAVLAGLKPGSLVINATGLGKDAPGSPLTDAARFPIAASPGISIIGAISSSWSRRALRRGASAADQDGWTYFLHGWTQVIAEVFHIDIPAHGPEFETLSKIAQTARKS